MSTARDREARDRYWRRKDNGEIDLFEKAARERERAAKLKEKAVQQRAQQLAQASRAADLRSVMAGGVVGLGLADREARAGAAAVADAMASPRSPVPLPSPLPSHRSSPGLRIPASAAQGPFYYSSDRDRDRDRSGPRRASPSAGRGRSDRVPYRVPDRIPDPTFLEHVNMMGNLADMVHQADQLRDQLRTQAMSIRTPRWLALGSHLT